MAAAKSQPKLTVEKRQTTGRKVKKLRDKGVLPANLYGKKVKSQSLKLDLKAFLPVYEEVGETGVVYLQVKGETKTRPVLIHNLQIHPVTDTPLHADFYQVSLKEKVSAEIPIELVGESPAVKDKLGVLIQPLSEVEVEALPTELPEKLEVDIGKLEKIDDAFVVGDLKAPKGVKILTSLKELLAKIESPTKEEEVAPPPKETEEGEENGEAGKKAGEGEEVGEGKEAFQEKGKDDNQPGKPEGREGKSQPQPQEGQAKGKQE